MKKTMLATMAIIVVLALVSCEQPPEPQPKVKKTVKSVTVSPTSATVKPGETSEEFFETVLVEGGAPKRVTWSLVGENDDTAFNGATFDEDANTVTVKADTDPDTKFRVKATSIFDTSKSGYATITVGQPPAAEVITVAISPKTATAKADETSDQFSATVKSTTNSSVSQSVKWSLVGENDDTAYTGATFGETSRRVTVNKNTAAGAKFRVKVVADADPNAVDYATFTVQAPDATLSFIVLDTEEVKKVYDPGEALDTTGIKITATYSDASEEELSAAELAKVVYTTLPGTPSSLVTGDSVRVTATYNGKAANYNIKVKRTHTAGDFEVKTGNLTQNVRNDFVPITIGAKSGITAGTTTVYYAGSTEAPTTAGTYLITFDVAASDNYAAISGLVMNNLTIQKTTITAADLDIDIEALQAGDADFQDGQALLGEEVTATIGWKVNKSWNANGEAPIAFVYYDADEERYTELPTVKGWYDLYVFVPALEGYYDAFEHKLFAFDLVDERYGIGRVDVNFFVTEKAPDIEGGLVSISGTGADKTKVIKLTGDFAAIEWYVDGTKDVNVTDTFTFDASTLSVSRLYYVTVRVKLENDWFSKTVRIMVKS